MWGLGAMAITFVAPHCAARAAARRSSGSDAADHQPHAGPAGRGARRRPLRSACSSPRPHSRWASAPSRDCSRCSPRRPSSPATTRSSHSAAQPPHREPRPHPRRGALGRPRPERGHRRDRGGEDDPRPGVRAPARRARRCRLPRPGRRRGLRRGRARPTRRDPRRPRSRGDRRAEARRRDESHRGAARLRRRADPRVRVGPQRSQGGAGDAGRAADRHVGAVRATAPGAALVPAGRPRLVRGRGAAAPSRRARTSVEGAHRRRAAAGTSWPRPRRTARRTSRSSPSWSSAPPGSDPATRSA